MNELDGVLGSTARPHRVLCLEIDEVGGVPEHRHVLALETAGADGAAFRWTLVQAIAAIRDGELFIVGEGDREQATVLEPVVCSRCRQATLTTHPPDRVEELPTCH